MCINQTVLTNNPEEAADFIRQGGLAAFPTETVYGLGADIFNEKAIRKIFEAKGRPGDNPLIAHIGNLNQISLLASEVGPLAERFIEAFFPGPLTLILPRRKEVPLIAAANLETIGIRMPRNKLARDFLAFCGVPLAAPSANLSGRPSPTTWQAVYEDLNGRIDCILQGAPTEIGLESTVLDCTSEIPVVLRSGAISLEELRQVSEKTQIYRPGKDEIAKSPGMRHKHYSPKAKVILLENSAPSEIRGKTAFIGINKPDFNPHLIRICSSIEEYAHEVFSFFRECDSKAINAIYCGRVKEEGLGLALMDRLRRAAE